MNRAQKLNRQIVKKTPERFPVRSSASPVLLQLILQQQVNAIFDYKNIRNGRSQSFLSVASRVQTVNPMSCFVAGAGRNSEATSAATNITPLQIGPAI